MYPYKKNFGIMINEKFWKKGENNIIIVDS